MSDNWICWSLFLDEPEFFLKSSQTTCGDVGAVWQGFLTQRLNYFLQFSSCGPWRAFRHSNSPSHHALGRYRYTSSSRQFRDILCWLEILNYCPEGGHGNCHCANSYPKPWLDNFMFIITLECSKLWIWMGIYFTHKNLNARWMQMNARWPRV